MKQIFLLILLCFTSLHCKSIVLTKKDIQYIDKNPNKKAIYLRLGMYINLKKKIKNFKLNKKLNYVNSFYNRILPVNDLRKYHVDDHWATPKEFLIQGKGDCEDYAIAKYFTLLEVGIPKNKLFLAVVKVKGATSYHMILTYIKNKKAMPLVLDNLSFRILPFNKRVDLTSKFIFNENVAYVLKNKKIAKKAKINWGKVDKWAKILNRIYKKNE